MPSINTLKDLYKANNLSELDTKSKSALNDRKLPIKRSINSSKLLYNKANEELKNGDEEASYMFFMRYMIIFESINTKDRDEYSKELGKETSDVIDKLERLKKSLTIRYKKREKAQIKRKCVAFNNQSTPGRTVPERVKEVGDNEVDENGDIYETIHSSELVDAIQSKSLIENILIIDIRPAKEFNESSISAAKFHLNGTLHVINIPRDCFTPSLTYSVLDRLLPKSGFSRQSLDQRNSMKKIVIIDTDGCPNIDDYHLTPSVILIDALCKWDYSPNKVQVKPKILKGGFEDFLICYPMFVTNSDVIHKSYANNFADHTMNKSSMYDFDRKEEEDEKDKKLEMNKILEKNIEPESQENGISFKNLFIASSGFADLPSNRNFPGTAKPVIPDRSSKPTQLVIGAKSQNNVEMENLEKTKNLYPTINDKLPSNGLNNQSYNNDIDSDEEMFSGEFDDINRPKQCPPTPQQKRKEFINDTEMSDVDQEENQSSPTNRSNPISMPKRNGHSYFGPSSSLSRSLSSPNVAQFDEMQSPFSSFGSSKITPLIDRSVKPQLQVSKRYDYYPKEREFSYQHTSKYGLPVGLRNLGNTCFMNAVLQCLNNTSDLTNYIRSGDVHINKKSKFGSNGELAIEFLELIKRMTFPSNYKCISPKDFKDAVNQHIPDFYDYKQQDAHEFLVRFLDRIHADMNENENCFVDDPAISNSNFYDSLPNSNAAKRFWNVHLSRNNSIVSRLFDGLILGILRCLDCDYSSKSLEAFTCLSLPVQEGSGRTSLQISLRNFFKKEKIEADWHCPRCRDKRNAEKSTIVWKLPKYLVIHLKRFSYEGLWRQKITTFVDFPIDNFSFDILDEDTTTYDLYGVVNHSGSLEGGHYISYSRSIGLFDWHRYDDSDVTPASACDVVTANAYVLFYQRRD